VLPGDPQYAAVMRGENVQPDPVNAKPRKAAETTAPTAPAWAASPAPAPASGGVPWANQGEAGQGAPKPQGSALAGPAWLNG
jgi:hypothetical protein